MSGVLRCCRVLLLTALCGAAVMASAATSGNGDSGQGVMLERKLALLSNLVERAPLAARIDASNDSNAQQLLGEARRAAASARDHLGAGALEEAAKDIDGGLRAAGQAARLVGDPKRERKLAAARYDELRKRILSFREAFERVMVEKKHERLDELLDGPGTNGLLRSAEQAAATGDYATANQTLEQVSARVEQALSVVRDHETLVHELHFDTPRQAYDYELERNQSHRMLIDLLARERQPGKETRAQLDEYLAHSARLAEQARELAEQDHVNAAIAKLEQGTDQLVRGLRALGVALP